MKKMLYILALSLVFSSTGQAEDINLTADEKVEWHQNDQKMIAIGNAIASKKDLSIRADKMTGYYFSSRVNGQNKSGIKNVHAVGAVVMKSPNANGFGDTMDYDVEADTMILKGNPAQIKTDKETITATESITYYPSKQQAVALGDVIASDNDNKIYSQKMISYFEKNATGNLEMKRVEIFDNVKIVTKDANVTAEKGVYLPQTGKVKLFNNVVIDQKGNILKGDMAETNLNTGISTLIAKKSAGRRVTGVFKEKEKDAKPSKTKE